MNFPKRIIAAAALCCLAACTVVPSASPPPAAPAPQPRPVPVRPPVVAPSPPAASQPATAPSANAAGAGVVAGPSLADLGITTDGARAALVAFRASCPALLRRADLSGLVQPQEWSGACGMAATWPENNALGFFVAYFETARIGDGRAYATGYYEPEIAGSRTPGPGYAVPVYRRPPDLIDVELGQFSDALAGKKIRGRIAGQMLVPYYDRTQIESGDLAGKGLEIAWAADPIEFFFLQVQGSGRLRLSDGSVMRIGYDGQNGRDYVGIGALMRDRGMLLSGQASMQGVMEALRAQPDGGRALMNENASFVFFRELTGAGPIGSLNVAVTPRVTVAADPAYVPLGAPVVLRVDRAEANGLWIAQDTGGAIKGANRFDTFWGAGAEARSIAGGMSTRGQAFILLPLGVIARLNGGSDGGTQPQR